jgi:hypothetical protein
MEEVHTISPVTEQIAAYAAAAAAAFSLLDVFLSNRLTDAPRRW